MQAIVKLNVLAVFRRSVIIVVFAFRRKREIAVAETNVFCLADDKQAVCGLIVPDAALIHRLGDFPFAVTDKITVSKGDV